MVEIVPLLAERGYRYIDLNFCELMNPDNDIDEDYIDTLDAYRDRYKISYNQCHVPYTNYYNRLSEDEKKQNDELIIRAFGYAGRLGVDTVVIHPIRGSIAENTAYFKRMLQYLPDTSRLAIENMESAEELSTPEELLELLESIGDRRCGICLDTGHAHMRGLELPKTVEKLGVNLIATHIADNHGTADEHFMPFLGNIDWEGTMKAMQKTGYKGFLTYEIMYFFRYIPDDLQLDMVDYSLKTASCLWSMLSGN